jgi:hypothetical protein
MDFFILLVLNIFIGAIIFLILSLKIEKISSTFQEKKHRELITEFNATAERNITLLDNRISVVRKLEKLLQENDSFKGVDFTILDDEIKENSEKRDIFNKQNNNKIDKKKEIDNSENQFHISRDGIKIKEMFKYDFHVDNEIDLNNNDLLSDEEIILNYKDQQLSNTMDIEELFHKTDDKYGLIASLFANGYSVEELSKYSGIPSGEIRLVISLNS